MAREDMTREETINFLKGYLDEEVYSEKCINAHRMAIKALEQETCENCVSRKEAIRLAEQGQIQGFEWQIKKLITLPPVTPTQEPCEGAISRQEVREFVEYLQTIKDKHNEEGLSINYGTICDLVIRGWKLVESEE